MNMMTADSDDDDDEIEAKRRVRKYICLLI